jgi:TolA-binding protein
MKTRACSGWHQLIAIATMLLAASTHAMAINRNVIELQVRVREMNDQAMIMQQSMDESFGALADSLKQSSARLSAVQGRLTKLMQRIKAQNEGVNSVSLTQQMTALRQSMGELTSRAQEIESRVQTLSAEIKTPTATMVTTGYDPPPDLLFRNGLEDYEAGRYKLAIQEFAEYVNSYSAAGQAGEAQFYLADCEYWAGQYQSAERDFRTLEQQYPGIESAAAELKTGMCRMKLAQPDAARNAFRDVIERYPDSIEAMDARSALNKIGMEARTASSYPNY